MDDVRSADTHRQGSLSEWEQFASRHAGNPFLEVDPLYALTKEILQEITSQIPTFFTEEQLCFEHDLIGMASLGFWHGRALGLPETGTTQGESLQQRHERAAREIVELLGEEMRRDGLTELEIKEHFQKRAASREVIGPRKQAYAGWLLVNSRFRDEVRSLRTNWATLVQQIGRFPRYPRWLISAECDPDIPNDFREDLLAFYRQWGLDQMATWDLPVPMEPDLVGGMLSDLHLLSETGVTLFVPWYLLRGEKLNLQDLARLERESAVPPHLLQRRGVTMSQRVISEALADLDQYATILKRFLADAVAPLPRLKLGFFNGIHLDKPIEMLLVTPVAVVVIVAHGAGERVDDSGVLPAGQLDQEPGGLAAE